MGAAHFIWRLRAQQIGVHKQIRNSLFSFLGLFPQRAGLSSRPSLPSNRRAISQKRRDLARRCVLGERVALEACDDSEGFSFWLAQTCAPGNSWQYHGPTMTEKGVKFRQAGWYITVKLLDRFPPSNPSTFKLVTEFWTVDAEGIIARQVQLESGAHRRTRSGASPTVYTLSKTEAERLEAAAEESFQRLELENVRKRRSRRSSKTQNTEKEEDGQQPVTKKKTSRSRKKKKKKKNSCR